MDKRVLLYVFGLTLLFYLMHQWFDYGRSDGEPSPLSEPKTQIEFSTKKKPAAQLSETELAKYQITKLFSDVQQTEVAALAFQQQDNFLTLTWQDPSPKELFAKSSDERITSSIRVHLRGASKKSENPALYTQFPLSKLLITDIPDEGTYAIYLLYFDQGKVYKIGGKTVGVDKIVLNDEPMQNALVFLEYEGNSTPYGFYDSENHTVEYLKHISYLEDWTILNYPQDENLQGDLKKQEYYVLENDYQQLVFTNLNGALAEINLPFHSEKDPQSVVREIELDRILLEDHTPNAAFPQYPYFLPDGNGKTKKMNPSYGGYYPLLRRNLIGTLPTFSLRINPHYYALNVFEKENYPDVEVYTLKRFEKDLIEFELIEKNRRITKIFTFPKDSEHAPYCIDLTIKIEGDARGLLLGTGIPEVELISNNFSPTLKYRILRNQKQKVENIKPPKELLQFQHIHPDWVCDGNGFFGIIVDPLSKTGPGFGVHPVPGEISPTRLSIIDAEYQRFPEEKYPGYAFHIPLSSKPGITKYRIFAGPFDKQILRRVDQAFTNPKTGYNPDYTAAQSYHGWFAAISQPFAKFLFFLLNFFHSFTYSWGISIILLTIALRLMLYPLNSWSIKSSVKMQQIAPKAQALQEKYKKDPKRVQLETMNLYRREGVNPFGGCLPMLIQLPFLFGMFDLLKSSFELRGATFIPGWISNLTSPDVLFSWKYPIPFIGNAFHLLPILLGAIMFFQQRLMSGGKTKGPITPQQKQQRSMGNIMTIVFTFLFYNFPSGLNIYWISSTLLSILQQWWVSKKILAKQPLVKK